MKKTTKLLLLLIWILIIAGTTYATWKAWGWVKWISETANEQKADRFTDFSWNTVDYWTWYYLDTYTWLKWAAQDSGVSLKWASGSRDSWDDNYYTYYPEPVWDGSSYTYNPPNLWVDTDYQAHKFCEGLWDGHWRLPTKNEMYSIMTYEKTSGMPYYTALESITNYNLWSSTVGASIYYANGWSFNIGNLNYGQKDRARRVLCIHD